MNIKCPNCNVVNFADARNCVRCKNALNARQIETGRKVSSRKSPENVSAKIARRAIVCLAVCLATVFAFYLSLIFTAAPLADEEKQTVKKAVAVLGERGFEREVFFLDNFSVLRADDNWLNASTLNETAYAATNFPFEVITIYPAFFTVPQDDTERAMVLLHEARHLQGKDEKEAYEFVWKNRRRLGWTKEKYGTSIVWRNVRKQTREYAPDLFVCDFNEYGDCTE